MAYYNESFEEKMYRLENTEQKYFADKIDPDIQDIYLCHGLRIWALDKLILYLSMILVILVFKVVIAAPVKEMIS